MNKRYIDFVPANNSVKSRGSARAVVRKTTVVRTVEEAPIEVPEEPIEALIEVPVEAPVRVQRKAPARLVRPTRSVRAVRQVRPNPQPRPAMAARARVAEPASVVRKAPVASAPVAKSMVASGGPALGVVEELNSHFVNTNVSKRPLSEKPARSAQSGRRPVQSSRRPAQSNVSDLKAKKVKVGLSTKSVAAASKKPASKPASKTGLSKEASTYKAPKPTFINQNKVVKRPLSSSGNVYRKQSAKAVKEEPKGPVTIIAKPEKDKHIGIIVTIIITIILGAAAGTVAFLLLPK